MGRRAACPRSEVTPVVPLAGRLHQGLAVAEVVLEMQRIDDADDGGLRVVSQTKPPQIKSLKNQPGAQVVPRRGGAFVINRLNPRFKGR